MDDQVARFRGFGTPGRNAWVALGVGALLWAVFAVTMESSAGPVVYLVAGAYGTLLTAIGAWRMPPARRRIWWAIAAGQALFFLGDVIWSVLYYFLSIEPYPSAADIAYLLSYPVMALGLMWLIRGRRSGRDRAAFLDAAILTTACVMIGTVFVIGPAAAAGGTSFLNQAVAAAYPAGDLLLLALVIRMLTTGTVRNLSLWALVSGLAMLFLVDLYYVTTIISGAPYPSWIDNGFVGSYLLIGFAALHPSAHALSEPAPDRPERVTFTRLACLGGALVLAPIADHLAHVVDSTRERGTWVILIGGVVSAILVVSRLWDLIHSLQRKAVQLAALARRDGLTGVANRRTWDHELSRACALAREHHTLLSVAVLDMDHFKRFNDTHGHVLGDLVLKETAAAWDSILHGRGFLARYGGEEFAVLLPRTSSIGAVGLLDQLRRTVSHGQTCSIGVAEWDGDENPAQLFARADEALYVAKHGGRDRIAVHDGSSTTVVAPTSPLTEALEASLRPVYQPIVNMRTGEVIAFEALSRFDGHDTAEVFATAARVGTGPALEASAITAGLAGWDRTEPLSINVSLTSLPTPEVQQALPTDLSQVILEITERDEVDYTPDLMMLLEELRARGARIAIDDFGVGYSNVERVLAIRPDIIKLAASLIRGVNTSPMLQAVVASCVVLAEQSDTQVVAEGVETPAERDYLIGAGVMLAQGYLFGYPEPHVARAAVLTHP